MKAFPLLAALLTAVTLPLSAGVKFESNAVKYKDSGLRPATGRSGSATLQGRTLIDSSGVAELQLTTGSFDPASSIGSIDKVQIKSESGGTINDNHLTSDGTYSVTLEGVSRGETIDVTAHVSGIDGRRTDIVSLTETAKLRPDLTVTGITLPATIGTDFPTMIDATLRELNGDVGARANCVLRVNGADVDSAEGIWIDAGGSVSCSFLHTFEAAGMATIEVALTNVNPGDYDGENNLLRRVVNVLDTLDMGRWSATAEETETDNWSVIDTSWGYHREYQSHGWTSSSSFSANWAENLDLNTLKASYVEKTDGVTIVELRDLALVRSNGAGGSGTQCLIQFTEEMTVRICQHPGQAGRPGRPARPKFINPLFSRRAGDATYISKEWGKPTPDAPDDGAYVRNESGRTTTGVRTRLGSSMQFEIEISDATHYYAERPEFPLQTTVTREEAPRSCSDNGWCSESSVQRTIKYGGTSSPGF